MVKFSSVAQNYDRNEFLLIYKNLNIEDGNKLLKTALDPANEELIKGTIVQMTYDTNETFWNPITIKFIAKYGGVWSGEIPPDLGILNHIREKVKQETGIV